MHQWAAPGSNWRPLPCEDSAPISKDVIPQDVAPTPSAACTCACTSEAENTNAGTADADQNQSEGTDQGGTARGSSAADQGDPLAAIVAALLALSPAERERLAGMIGKGAGNG